MAELRVKHYLKLCAYFLFYARSLCATISRLIYLNFTLQVWTTTVSKSCLTH